MTDSGEERNKNFITVICLLLIKGGFFFFCHFMLSLESEFRSD